MKKVLSVLLLILFQLVAIAQNSEAFFKVFPTLNGNEPEWVSMMYSENPNVGEVEDAFRNYYKTNEFVKTIHTQNHKHWIQVVEPLIDERGFIFQPTREEQEVLYQKQKSNYQKSKNKTSSVLTWTAMGPFETYKKNSTQPISWHKNIYSIDQSMINSNLLICGTEAGGVYKSTNKAADWILISKGEVFSGGNSAVKIHPTDTDNYLLASNKRIYQTLDGGLTWIERYFTNGTGNEFQYATGNDSLVFHTSTSGFYKSTNGGFSWTQVYSDKCWDIDFHPTDSSIAYLLKSNSVATRSELFKSTDGGNSWALQDSGYYDPINQGANNDFGGKIAVTPAAPNRVYVALIGNSKAGDDGWISVYRSDDAAATWTNPSGQDGGPYGAINSNSKWNIAAYSSGYHQGFFNFDLEASTTDSNKIWVATIRLSESSDGGQTFNSIGAANSNRLNDIHADVQDIEVVGSDIWVASDGGINYSSNELISHVALNRGIQAAHFWGFNTGWNEDSYTGGKYHDGTTGWFESYSQGKAYNIGGVEEASGYVHPIESRKLLFRTHYSSNNTSVKTVPSVFGGATVDNPDLPIRPNESYNTAQRSGVYFDPRYADHIYVGLNNKVYKSTNGGGRFKTLFTFPDSTGMIYEIEISRSNPDVMYAVYNPSGGYWSNCVIYKSTNGGASWNKTQSDPSGNRRRFRISIHPENEDVLWICTPRGINSGKVHSTTDGGNTWVDRTTSILNGENLTDILYQGGSNGVVYIVSQNGVFYWDTATSNWVDYSAGLPLVANALQINPFYRDGQLRLASSGRGVWGRDMKDTLFSPIAQPITYADSLYCARDTSYFDCYSILKHQGASWYWNISPQPAFIDSDSIRNPKVYFGAAGSYSVSLTVTDAQGNSDTKTIANMVTVSSDCEPDTIPGKAVKCQSNSSYVQTALLPLSNTDSVTFSAWIKPSGSQNDYSGIIINDASQTAGLNIRTGNMLGYHWPGGHWYWNSGLVVPLNEWSHVAMVVTPNGVTIYLNGVGSTHAISLSPADLSYLKMGSYKGWNSRNFNGEIDEVCIWDRALSQDEIRELRHLTRTGITPFSKNLVVYYQFNSSQADIALDRVGGGHAGLVGTAQKVISSAPVGGGESDRLQISSSGKYMLPNTETEIHITQPQPNGEIVLTRINWIPNTLPSSNPYTENYWILNNYANTFGALDTLKFKPTLGSSFGDPNDFNLYTRQENGDLNNWNLNCAAWGKDGGTYNYDNSCNISNGSQFFIQSNSNNAIQSGFIGIVENSFSSEMKLYPNPNEGQLTLELGKTYSTISIRIMNSIGQQVFSKYYSDSEKINLNIDGEPGFYTIEIIGPEGEKAFVKVVKI